VSASSPRNARRSTGRHRKPEPPNSAAHWLRIGAATAGIGAAVAFGPGVAFADDGAGGGSSNSSADGGGTGSSESGGGTAGSETGTAGSTTPKVKSGAASGSTHKNSVDPESKKDEPADDDTSGSKHTTKHTTKTSTLSRHTAAPASSGTPTAKVQTVDDPPSSPAVQKNSTPAAATAVTPAATSGPNLPTAKAGLTALANAPQVTAAPPKVTLRSIVVDLLNWTGLKALAPFLPIPSLQLPFLDSAWAAVRNANRTFNNQRPVIDPTIADKPVGGVYKGNLNATDYDHDTLTYTPKIDAKLGTVTVAADGSFTFTPSPTLAANGGTAIFTIKVDDQPGNPKHVHGWYSLWGIYSSPVHTFTVKVPAPKKT
jgi:bacillolysin